jgi:hypothetical protein
MRRLLLDSLLVLSILGFLGVASIPFQRGTWADSPTQMLFASFVVASSVAYFRLGLPPFGSMEEQNP